MGNLFELAEAVELFYGTKGADAAIEEFRDAAQDYRLVTKAEGQVAWLSYVLRLLFICPVLLQRPAGLEWVTDDLQWALRHRKLRPDVDRDFWDAMKKVRGRLTQGRPGNKARDFFWYEWLVNLMYPLTTHSELGLVRTKKRVNKTMAVTELIDMEERCYGQRPSLREIWRSLQHVEAYIETLQVQLHIAQTNVAGRARKPRSG
ncbi:MAG: hypothetical protein JJE16_08495 [Nitrospiraceae bacterium]|nr:hypothetical protein [Nitrospiraceae bacterium]